MHSPFGNLPACRQDLETAWANTSAGSLSLFPNYGPGWETHLSANLHALQQKILQALPSFPEHYQTTLNHSFVPLLTNPTMMTQMLPAIYQNKETEAIFTDLALAILSRGAEDKTIRNVTRAYQEIIADLHHQWFRKANIKQHYQAGIVKFSNA
ncbi:MAG: hypothetical protein KDK65_05835, partial [Chlamydiia bacterium]|nr:hypothetical protein [Chlamydiia bacterium]